MDEVPFSSLPGGMSLSSGPWWGLGRSGPGVPHSEKECHKWHQGCAAASHSIPAAPPPPNNSSRQSLLTPKGREKVTCCVQPHLQGISQSQASQLHPREMRNQPWLQGLPGSTLRGLGLHSTQITPKGATCKAVPRAASVHKETSHPGALLSLLLLAL